jgi:glycosyltransferase involved in cell wall biosynthesis
MKAKKQVVFVQFGDFFGAVERLRQGGGETYFAQRYSVELVERLPSESIETTVLTVASKPFEAVLPSGVRCVGSAAHPHDAEGARVLIVELEKRSPTEVVLRTPSLRILRWCLRSGVRVLPLLADSFRASLLRPRQRLFTWRLARLLNDSKIPLVANHQVPACRDLVRLGVRANKVVPWDWPHAQGPHNFAVKRAARESGKLSVVFAGKICEAKGVGDLIEAVALLKQERVPVRVQIVGGGEVSRYQELAQRLEVSDSIRFEGLIPHERVLALMHESDAVVVPSRHAYGEGLPMVIFDALTSRSPLVVSDHPMFLARLRDGESALFFPEKNAVALAGRLRKLADNTAVYQHLSEMGEVAWQALQIPVLWGELVARWISGTEEDMRWLSQFSMGSHDYL